MLRDISLVRVSSDVFFYVVRRAFLLGYEISDVGRRLRSPPSQLVHAGYSARHADSH